MNLRGREIKKKPKEQIVITREQIDAAMKDFFKRGGKITKTDSFRCDDVNYFDTDDASNFLIGN